MVNTLSKIVPAVLSLPICCAIALAQIADQGVVTSDGQCAPVRKTFYEIDGIVSMEAEHASFVNGWSRASLPFDTAALQADGSHAWKGGVLRFDIEFTTPGKYALWVLARKGTVGGRYSSNDFKVWLDRDLSLGEIPHINHRETGKFDCLIDAGGRHPTPHPRDNPDKRESERTSPEAAGPQRLSQFYRRPDSLPGPRSHVERTGEAYGQGRNLGLGHHPERRE